MDMLTYALLKRRVDAVDPKTIYGVSWDKGSISSLTRTDASVGMVANAGVDGTVPRNDFDNGAIYRDITEVTDTLGNFFIRIPKFYIRKTDGVGSKTWQISRFKHSGFYLPWCFWDFTNNRELPYVDVGKYKATQDGSSRLESKAGKPPLVSTHIVGFRTKATANNAGGLLGYQQLDIHVVDVLQALFYIEFATLNSQSIMQGFTTGRYGVETDLATAGTVSGNHIDVTNATGAQYHVKQTISVGTARYGTQVFYGRTITAIAVDTPAAGTTRITFDGAPVNITTGNFLQNTGAINGFSAGIAASSGSLVSNSDGKYPCVYRGIESPWGDIWQFVDGVNVNERQAWVAENAADYTSNAFASPYKQLGYANSAADGYVSAMGHDPNNPFAVFPAALGAGPSSYYADYYYQAAGQLVALVGGTWSSGAFAGASDWFLGGTSSLTSVGIGGRLLKKPL